MFRKNVVTSKYKILFVDAKGYESDTILEAESEQAARLMATSYAREKGWTVKEIEQYGG